MIEALLDRGRGPVATVLVQDGTLQRRRHRSSPAARCGKVRAMLDDRGETRREAGPSTPVEVLGLDDVPERRRSRARGRGREGAQGDRRAPPQAELQAASSPRTARKVSLEDLIERSAEGAIKELKLVLKADVQGSVEALEDALAKLSTDEGEGQRHPRRRRRHHRRRRQPRGRVDGDHHRLQRPPGRQGRALAEHEGVEIRLYNIIYDAIDDVEGAMAACSRPTSVEKALGKAEVRADLHGLARSGTIAGCMVTEGKITRTAPASASSATAQSSTTARSASLRRFKDDVSEVAEGFECGIMLDGLQRHQGGRHHRGLRDPEGRAQARLRRRERASSGAFVAFCSSTCTSPRR